VTDDQIFEANLLIEYAMEDLAEAEELVKKAGKAGRTISTSITKSDEDVAEGKKVLQKVETRMQYTSDFLAGEDTETESIVNPISTNIVSITVSDDRLSFAYPYLLILVIMFIGLLLASTLIVTDKISRAAFRNFTTPTTDGYHVRVAFFTAFLLLLADVAVILVLSSFFVAQPLLLNFGSTLLIISVAIVLFTFLGMIIGYLSKTQEASMIASISVGSILLFVSNLVLPMEGMTRFVQSMSVVNPYIVLSELLKRSMLYGVTAQQISRDLAILAGLCVILLIVTVMVQRYFRKKYFKQEESLLPVKMHVPKPLMLGETHIHDAVELMDVLDRMTMKEFDNIVKNKNIIANWVSTELRIKRLGKQLRTKSKERMILKLDKYLERHAKSIKR
ncbi:ABC transporter permease, partial [Candidatus Woesearchaeota archaeon]|nr:ABC transporter permease [Candidatus Woesearchaeota archaeon]